MATVHFKPNYPITELIRLMTGLRRTGSRRPQNGGWVSEDIAVQLYQRQHLNQREGFYSVWVTVLFRGSYHASTG